MTIRKFFKEYASTSLRGKAKELAKFYADNFMIATKAAASAFKNDKKFIEWLNGVAEFNQKAGLQKMEVKKVKSVSIGEYHAQATVTWVTVFEKNPTEEISFDIHYILNKIGKDFKIVLYISEEDQEELMKKHGLL